MSRVLDFFREEARTCLDGMRAVLAASTEQSVDAEILYRHARRLRGSAQMARQAEIQTLAAELEGAARKLAGADVAWSARVREAVNARVNRLATMVDEAVVAVPEQPEGEANVSTEVHALYEKATRLAAELAAASDLKADALTQRLNKALDDLGTMASQVGLEEVSQLAGHARARLQASGANAVMALLPTIREAMAAAPPPEPEPEDEAETPGVEGFQPFGAEVEGPADAGTEVEPLPELEPLPGLEGTETAATPEPPIEPESDVEPAPPVVPEPPAEAEPPIEPEPEPVAEAPEPAEETVQPAPSEGLDDSMTRESADVEPGAEVPPASPGEVPAPAAAAGPEEPDPGKAEEDVVPMGQLIYRGDRALERALELRTLLENKVGADAEAREALDEIFDLIRLGRA